MEERQRAAAALHGGAGDDELNQQIFDVLAALLKLEAPMTMKDLGTKLGCDPSFVTTIADALERRGLARREPSERDRRSKNLVLTPEGVTLRDRLCAEFAARAPWCTALDAAERRCLLDLARKMLRSGTGGERVTTEAAVSS